MANLVFLTKQNAARWERARITRSEDFGPVAKRLVSQKARLQTMQARTKVPWFVIAVIKQRECGNDPGWNCNIANGQRWNQKTSIVPIGRGPFGSWEEAAFDALTRCAPYASRWGDWSAGGTLTLLEQYNGLGYANKGVPSPYIWSGTDQYKSGKYVRDHVYDPKAVDQQLGCAGLLKAMMALDSSITFSKAPAVTVPPPPDIHPPSEIDAPKKGAGFWEAIVAMFKSIFTRGK